MCLLLAGFLMSHVRGCNLTHRAPRLDSHAFNLPVPVERLLVPPPDHRLPEREVPRRLQKGGGQFEKRVSDERRAGGRVPSLILPFYLACFRALYCYDYSGPCHDEEKGDGFRFTPPLRYLDFLFLL